MGMLDTFFLRYRADTAQAVKDVKKLENAENELGKKNDANAKKGEANSGKRKKALKEEHASFEEVEGAAKKFGTQLGELGSKGGNKLGVLRETIGSLGEVVGSLGPAALIATVGIGAVVGAVAIAREGIDEARESAKEAIELGKEAFEARLSQNELIRLQNRGSVLGISESDTNASAKGMWDRSNEIRAAQRQAARDPASAFNNPLIKQGNLFKKAGVDVAASLAKQIEQEDKYLRALAARGEADRALIEGTQLFGRSLMDIKATLSTTQQQLDAAGAEMAKNNELRRKVQAAGESLNTAETKLAASRKASDNRVLQYTIPATEKYTQAVDELTRQTAGLQEAWGRFVADCIAGVTKMAKFGSDFARSMGAADTRTREERVKEAGDDAAKAAVDHEMRGFRAIARDADEQRNSPEMKAIAAAARAKAEADEGAKYDAEQGTVRANATQQDFAGNAVKTVIGNGTFEGKALTPEQQAQATAQLKDKLAVADNVKTQEDANVILRDILHSLQEDGKVQKAQVDYTKKIEANTLALVNTGLEQAMALWAGSAGKGSGVVSGGSYSGETQAGYQARALQMQRTINPNAATHISMDRSNPAENPAVAPTTPVGALNRIDAAHATLGKMDSQADSINKSETTNNNVSNKGDTHVTVNTGDLHSHKSDVADVAADFSKHLTREMELAVSEFSSPVVS